MRFNSLLSAGNRVRLAEGVMDLRRSSRLFAEGFTTLTEVLAPDCTPPMPPLGHHQLA